MRINKTSDSPLNESKFSDLYPKGPILDNNLSHSFKPNCYYHPDQYITNFCRSPACLLPLCPECVKIHATKHKSQGTHGEFDTIDNTVSECYQELMKNEINFRDDESNFKDFLKLNSEYHQLMMQKLLQSKKKLIEIIESYYNKLAIDIDKRVSMQVQRVQAEIHGSLEKLNIRQNQTKEYMNYLRSPKILKSTIHLLSSTFFAEQNSSHKEFQSLYSLLHSQKIDIVTDDNMLHNVNCALVKYVNVVNADLYKIEEAPALMTQKIITTSKPNQMFRSQSPPPVIMASNLKSPQKSQIFSSPQQGVIFVAPQQQLISRQQVISPQQNPASMQVFHPNPPLGQSKMFQPNVAQTQFLSTNQYQSSVPINNVNNAPKARFLGESTMKVSSANNNKIHKVHPSIPGDPLIIDFNKGEKEVSKENRTVSTYANNRQNLHIAQPTNLVNKQVMLSASPPIRVRSVSPTTQVVKVVYNSGFNKNTNMNAVYLENEEREGFLEIGGGIRNTHVKKKEKK